MEKKGRESFFNRFGRGSKSEADRKLKANKVLASQSLARTESPLTRGVQTSESGSSTVIEHARTDVFLSTEETNSGAVPITVKPAQLAVTEGEKIVVEGGSTNGRNVNEGSIHF
jgi:hypothetical protein